MAPSGAGPNATALPSSPTDGAGIFAGTCARCHGSQGEGKQVGGRGAPAIQGTPLDEVVTTVTQGKKAMPSFGSRLSKEQIQAVAEYVSKQLKS
jgi:cytochrome c6